MLSKLLTFLVLLVLAIIDIGPVPMTNLLCLYVLFFRPRWFKDLVDKLYRH